MRYLTPMQEDFMHRADYIAKRDIRSWETLGQALYKFDINVMDIPVECGGIAQDMMTQLLALEDIAYNSIDLAMMLIESYYVQDVAKINTNNHALYKYVATHIADGKGFACYLYRDKDSAPLMAYHGDGYWKFDGVLDIRNTNFYESSIALVRAKSKSGFVFAFIPTRLLHVDNDYVNIIKLNVPEINVVTLGKIYSDRCEALTNLRFAVTVLGAARAISNRLKYDIEPAMLMKLESYVELCRHQFEHLCELYLDDRKYDLELYAMKLGLMELLKLLSTLDSQLYPDELYFISEVARRLS